MNTKALAGRNATERTRRASSPLVMAAIWVGLALTVIATTIPYGDRAASDTLADHIQAGYPTYSHGRIDTAATTYLVYLTVIGVAGVVAWLASARALQAGKWWARAAATATFLVAICIAVTDVLIKDTSGDTGLPPHIAWAGILPCVPGLFVVIVLWIGDQK